MNELMPGLHLTVIGALIGIGGTLLGVILGSCLDFIKSNIGIRSILIDSQNIQLEKVIPDGEGSYTGGKHIYFRCTIVNRKPKPAVIEKIRCICYQKGANNALFIHQSKDLVFQE